ncbi:MAG: outer membrane beta-barrel protein [Bacteroidota bacterium]
MKKRILLLIIIIVSKYSFSQDTIFMISNETQILNVVEISSDKIKCTPIGVSNFSEINLNRSRVLSIHYKNGRVEYISEEKKKVERGNSASQNALTTPAKASSMNSDLTNMQKQILKSNNDSMLILMNKLIEQNSKLIENAEQQKEILAKPTEKKWDPKIVGLGLNILERVRFNITELSAVAVAKLGVPFGHSIFLPISPTKNFRLEPEFGFSSINYSSDTAMYVPHTYQVKLYGVGMGIFGQFQKGRANVYLGARFAYHSYEQKEALTYTTKVNSGTQWQKDSSWTDKSSLLLTGTSFTPTVGAEWAFSEHFTIGGEIGAMCYFNNNSKYSVTNHGVTTNTKIKGDFQTVSSQSRLVLRFYLGGNHRVMKGNHKSRLGYKELKYEY